MSHQRKLIRQAVVALLIGANTAAGARVLGTRVEPHKKSQLPAISVYTLSEGINQALSGDSAPRELTRDLKLEIAGWVAHSDEHPVDDAMDDLAEQIEAVMDTNWYIAAALVITAVDHTTGELTIVAHGLATGDRADAVSAGPGGIVPTGLNVVGESWAIVIDANTIKLANSGPNALAGTALTFSDNGTLPLRLPVATAADSILEATEMQVVEDDGRSDPLVGIVTVTYSVTYRTSPATATTPDDFITADAKQQLVGGVADTAVAEDTFTAQESP